MPDKIVYSTGENKPKRSHRQHDIGTPERHAKGDIEAYTNNEGETFARAMQNKLLKYYLRIGYIDKKQAEAGELVERHYRIGMDPAGPQAAQMRYCKESKGAPSPEDQDKYARMYAHSKQVWRDICRLLDHQQLTVLSMVCIDEKKLSALDGMHSARRGGANHCRLTCALDILVDYFEL